MVIFIRQILITFLVVSLIFPSQLFAEEAAATEAAPVNAVSAAPNISKTTSENLIQDGLVKGSEVQSVVPQMGNANVTPSGSFSYNIPIEMPPGRQGMQPGISLTYDSNVGNGLLGV